MNQHNREFVIGQTMIDASVGISMFLGAYILRFDTGLFSTPKGQPEFQYYLQLAPFIGLLFPLGLWIQGAYRQGRIRSHIDDFFAVFVGGLIAVVLGLAGTLYFQAYYVSPLLKEQGAYEISRIVWALFLLLSVTTAYAARATARMLSKRRWRRGIGLKRILIAGMSDIARHMVDKILEHEELGYRIIGFVDDRGDGDHLGYRGLPLLGSLSRTGEILKQDRVDQLYVALPLDEHVKMLELIEVANRECVDVKVVPDLLQVIALRARVEELDGVPIININDVPLQGIKSVVKRGMDVTIASVALACLSLPFTLIGFLIKSTSRGPIFYRQERMGLDGRSFGVLKFRSMWEDAEKETGPVWTRKNDPRRTPVGRVLRKFSLDELPQLWNVLRGDMSLVGPRPERPFFVEQFKEHVPQYMLRHKVKSGMTGWAQVNGWRGDTSIEKRIEYDLFYIENWSMTLDFKILWLTVLRGFFHRHAY
ncbi:MAG: undecaprenyl-phosphate glucose phosphotransferase [Acidobacteria bacterium]|nr:undecaprenyl-phosphate glucose phosphotransferase [Acidobacteriota bacterium]|tara:strand:+ start:703 stop:2139 length:1437 start_codon:yes stop_codon:yes gene_type:complete